MKNNQTKEANKVRLNKKNEQDFLYKELFRVLVKEHADKKFICDDCLKLNFCGEKNHPTPNFLVGTLNTLGYPTPRQVGDLGLEPYNTFDFQNVRSSIELKKWDPKQVRRILINRNASPISPLEAFFVDED